MSETFVSVHIPKTAGELFRRLITALPVDAYYFVYDESHPEAGFRLANDGNTKQTRRVWSARVDAFVKTGSPLIERLLIHGHVLASKYRPWVPESHFITWLRDPVQRVASHYYFWKRMEYPFDKDWCEFKERNWSLVEFASQAKHRNLQSLYLKGLTIENTGFVGIVEEFDQSIRRFERVFGVQVPKAPARLNANPEKSGESWDLDGDTRDRIAELNSDDLTLYAAARAML